MRLSNRLMRLAERVFSQNSTEVANALKTRSVTSLCSTTAESVVRSVFQFVVDCYDSYRVRSGFQLQSNLVPNNKTPCVVHLFLIQNQFHGNLETSMEFSTLLSLVGQRFQVVLDVCHTYTCGCNFDSGLICATPIGVDRDFDSESICWNPMGSM